MLLLYNFYQDNTTVGQVVCNGYPGRSLDVATDLADAYLAFVSWIPLRRSKKGTASYVSVPLREDAD